MRLSADQDKRGLSYHVEMSVDPPSPAPGYQQLADILRARIHAGEFSAGPFPSERTLRETYDVDEFTVTQALKLLMDQTLIFFSAPRQVYYVSRNAATS
jgi:DNA-binding transcriptional regulator YhcF (GntR family)